MPNATIANLLTDVTRKGGISSDRYTNAVIMRVFTIAAQSINAIVMRNMKDGDFQGEKSTRDLVANQREYLFPNDFFKVKKIDLKIDGTNWKTADFMDESEITDDLANETQIVNRFSSLNPKVTLYDESFFIYSGTISNVTGGILLWYNKDIVGQNTGGSDITAFSATTDVPTLLPFAAQALVLWAIIDWYQSHWDERKLRAFNRELWGDPAGQPADDRQIGGLMRRVINHYSDRAPDREISIGTVHQEEHYQ